MALVKVFTFVIPNVNDLQALVVWFYFQVDELISLGDFGFRNCTHLFIGKKQGQKKDIPFVPKKGIGNVVSKSLF